MRSSTEFTAGITLTKPVAALVMGTADPIGHKGWTVLDTTKSGTGTVVVRFADGTEKTLTSFVLPVPAAKQQNRILVRVSVVAVDEANVAVEAVEAEEVL